MDDHPSGYSQETGGQNPAYRSTHRHTFSITSHPNCSFTPIGFETKWCNSLDVGVSSVKPIPPKLSLMIINGVEITKEADLAGVNLSHTDLRSLDLSETWLGGALFNFSDLTGARMVGTSLRHAICQSAIFAKADLRFANLWNADLTEAQFQEANMSRSWCGNARLFKSDLSSTDLSGAWLTGANLTSASLTQATLAGTVLSRTCLHEADLTGSFASGADFRGAILNGAIFRSANLSGAIFTGASLIGVDFSGADLINTDLTNAQIQYATIDNVRHDDTTMWPQNYIPPPSVRLTRHE